MTAVYGGVRYQTSSPGGGTSPTRPTPAVLIVLTQRSIPAVAAPDLSCFWEMFNWLLALAR